MAGGTPPRLRLLGGWELDVASEPVAVPPAGQRLIALLALRGSTPRPRAAALLAPQHRPQAAAARLRDVLSRCLRCCPALSQVLTVGADLALDQAVQVDRWELDVIAAGLAGGDVAALRSLGALPADLELLPGWDEDWVIAERDLMRRRLSRALCRYSAEHLRLRDAQGALIAAERASTLDPLDEVAARWQIRAHLAAGDAALAVRTFDELQTLLRRELGIDPDPATVQLVGALVARMSPPAHRARPAVSPVR